MIVPVLLLILVLSVFVSDDLVEFDLGKDLDALLSAHVLDLLQDLLVFEGIWIDDWQVTLHRLIRWIMLLNMADSVWDCQDDVPWVHTTV